MNLEKFNMALLEIEDELRDPTPWDNAPAFYFVIGAPRSGTTLLTQLLAYCFDIGYITNLAARFYLNPVLGMQLSRNILGDVKPSFNSRYANTDGAGGIHEFGQFWMSHLGLSSSQDVDWMVPDEDCAFLTLRALRAIQSEAKKSVVMKGIYPSYCSEWINDNLVVRWVNIEREPIDACLSILEARRNKSRGSSKWFGWHIPQRDRWRFASDNPYREIAGQVKYFQRVYREIADVSLSLEMLCSATGPELCYATGGCAMVNDPPELTYSRKQASGQDREKFEEALRVV